MEMLLTLIIVWVILKVNTKATDNHQSFIKELAIATRLRYSKEYEKLRTPEESEKVLTEHLRLISTSRAVMDAFHYQQFKAGICDAIHNSDKRLKAELCFIHDLMLEEYHKLVPDTRKEFKVGVNEFYNILRTHL